jgi:hypothetical protein
MATTLTIVLYAAFSIWRAYKDRECHKRHSAAEQRITKLEQLTTPSNDRV